MSTRGRPPGEVPSPQPSRRILTKPSEPAEGKPHDNVNSDLIVSVGDELRSQLGTMYVVQELLGQGTFGQVFRCQESSSKEIVAVKVVKAQPAYFQQARVEVGILQYLNTKADPGDERHIVRMKDFFVHLSHLCLVFELLSLNLYEVIRRNKFRGFTLSLVRVLVLQILSALDVLHQCQIIHCDLKPENVLLKSGRSGEVKVIDFGSACFQSRTVYSYIQSRFYRSPEVILGCPYTPSIDMWSLGCLAAELFLGLPLFPGACEHDMLTRISTTLGPFPDEMLVAGRNTSRHYRTSEDGMRLTLRTAAEFEAASGTAAPVGKSYFKSTHLAEIIAAYPMRPGATDAETVHEMALRASFVDFLRGTLALDPARRWTPRQAADHPFLVGGADGATAIDALRTSPPISQPLPMPVAVAAAQQQLSWQPQGVNWRLDVPVAVQAQQTSVGSVPDINRLVPSYWPQQQHLARVSADGLAAGIQQQQQQGFMPAVGSADYQTAGWPSSLLGTTPHGAMTFGSLQLTPPSRTFVHQARLLEGAGSWRGGIADTMGMDSAALSTSLSSAGLLPLLPAGSATTGGFQPRSVTSYAAALAAAQQAAAAAQQSVANAAAAAAQQQQYEAAQLAVANAFSQQHTQQLATGSRAAYHGGAIVADECGAMPPHAAYTYQQAGPRPSQVAGSWGAQAPIYQPRGSASNRTVISAHQTRETIGFGTSNAPSLDVPPEPGDWDPLWSDDLLREEEDLQGEASMAPTYQDPHLQQVQVPALGRWQAAQPATSINPNPVGSYDHSAWYQQQRMPAYSSSLPPMAPGRPATLVPQNASGLPLFLSQQQQPLNAFAGSTVQSSHPQQQQEGMWQRTEGPFDAQAAATMAVLLQQQQEQQQRAAAAGYSTLQQLSAGQQQSSHDSLGAASIGQAAVSSGQLPPLGALTLGSGSDALTQQPDQNLGVSIVVNSGGQDGVSLVPAHVMQQQMTDQRSNLQHHVAPVTTGWTDGAAGQFHDGANPGRTQLLQQRPVQPSPFQ